MKRSKVPLTTGRRRRESLTSRRFYEPRAVDKKLISLIEITGSEPKKQRTEQSRHLPFWAWYVIAKANGIPLKQGQKPIFGTILHAVTFTSALAYAVSYTWYKVYDILSDSTEKDIPGAAVSIFLVYCWCAFGFYCKTLCSRLFLHERFLKDVRVHSRTVFKISATLLTVMFGILFSASHIYEETEMIDPSICEQVKLNYIVCLVSSVSSIAFTFFTLIWHSLVSFVFISVCRTHTIGLRCFIKEIESDSLLLQQCHTSVLKHITSDSDGNVTDIDDEDESIVVKNSVSFVGIESSQEVSVRGGSSSSGFPVEQPGEINVLLSPVSDNLFNSEKFNANEINLEECDKRRSVQSTSSGECRENDGSIVTGILSCSDILHNYWKLNRRLRFSSSTLQRWFASFMALVLLRCSTYLVHWLGHPATIMDILQFALPLIYMVVLSSAIAEVNFEGQRFQRSLYPTEQRLKIFQFLVLNPLQMPIYGFGVTHGTIVTVVFAILVGFITRIVITELTK